ncbi:GAF and ANTAR domain-containing protein [Amycolatopsis orientalis]|uniref:GAF and ANTAR domain-containing protein n=1 Tax=Amycolatopsis orientalis TaxID=31958 RepID=UPI0004250219|nr:GAF and ANTAR domain-containing protein [Amycolatopsis orientalis]
MARRAPGIEHLDELATTVAALTRTLETESDETVLLNAVCVTAVRAVPGADMASITVVRGDRPETAAGTDPRAFAVDSVQYETGDGPCLRAARTGRTVRLSVEEARESWPRFTASAEEAGVGSYLSTPLDVDEQLTGALNLFGLGTHGFQDDDSHLLRLYTTVVNFGLRNRRKREDARTVTRQLETAIQNRAVIEQAKGILMAVHRITAEEAFRRLITESQHTNTKLHDVAARFVRDARLP